MATTTAFPELRDAVRRLYDIPRVAEFFHALALCEAYDYMATLAQERVTTHPEVIRAPILGKFLMAHFHKYPEQHISIQKDTIFDESAIGNIGTLMDWQQKGYSIPRTAKNYFRRLRKWIAIYDETDYIVEMRVRGPNGRLRVDRKKNPSGTHADGSLDFDSPNTGWTTKTQNYGRVKDRSGNLVTYTSVVEKRNSATGESLLVMKAPFWLPLNYGTAALGGTGMGTGPSGYPKVGGLHFREDAELRIPQYLDKYADLLDRFAYDVLNGRITRADTLSAAHDWARRRVPQGEIIEIAKVARRISYLPF